MNALPGLDMSTGSLGLGLGAGVGMALGGKLAGHDFTTFVVVGDGECNEGIVWEAAHVAQIYALDNLVVVVDQNGLQQFGWRGEDSVRRRAPYSDDDLSRRWSAFGWAVSEVDGHDFTALVPALEKAKATPGPPRGRHRADGEGQGSLLHGRRLSVARWNSD